jgi:hypothetical protein
MGIAVATASGGRAGDCSSSRISGVGRRGDPPERRAGGTRGDRGADRDIRLIGEDMLSSMADGTYVKPKKRSAVSTDEGEMPSGDSVGESSAGCDVNRGSKFCVSSSSPTSGMYGGAWARDRTASQSTLRNQMCLSSPAAPPFSADPIRFGTFRHSSFRSKSFASIVRKGGNRTCTDTRESETRQAEGGTPAGA